MLIPRLITDMHFWIMICVLKGVEAASSKNINFYFGPYTYPNQNTSQWYDGMYELTNFTLNFTKFELEESHGCKADWFSVWNIQETSRRIGPLCGIYNESFVLSTVDYGLRYKFSSDYSWAFGGFDIEINYLTPDTEKVCDMFLNKKFGRISSYISDTFNRYPSSLDCQWDIDVPEGFSLLIHFAVVNIEYSGVNCHYDKLEIFERQENSSGLPYLLENRVCGRHNPWTLTSSNGGRLKFYSDSVYSLGQFQIYYFLINGTTVKNKMSVSELIVNPWTGNIVVSSENFPDLLRFKAKPGFKIELVINLFETDLEMDDALVGYDGPDEEHEILNLSSFSKNFVKILSSGFYVTLKSNANRMDIFWANITYRSLPAMTTETTNIIIKGDQDLFLVRNSGNKNIQYFTFAVAEGKYPRVAIDSFAKFFEINPNINDCEKTGIVLYQGELQYENILGPFCDITPNYVKYILEATIGSSSVLNAAVYDYAYMHEKWNMKWFALTASHCKGYQLTEYMFQSEKTITSDTFWLSAYNNGTTNVVELETKENLSEDCYLILILPDTPQTVPYELRPSGYLEYRICKRWETKESEDFAERFQETESCTRYHKSTEGYRHYLDAAPSEWSIRYYWIEIGSVTSNQCEDVPSCNQQSVINLNCGVIRADYPSCTWSIHGQYNKNWLWQLELSKLNSNDNTTDAVVFLHEYSSLWNEETVISYYKIGEGRTFRYKTMGDLNLTISSRNVGQMVMGFQRLPVVPLINYDIGCHASELGESILFKGHCYFILQHGTSVSWNKAQSDCDAKGASLVSINTLDELNFLKKVLLDIWNDDIWDRNNNVIFIGLSDLSKAGDYIWQDSSPLTVSDWYYPFAPFDHVVSPNEIQLNVQKIQPSANASERCVVMVPRNTHYSTNWKKVACKHLHPPVTNSICEFNFNGATTQNDVDLSHKNVTNLYASACTDGWNFVQNRCLAVLTHDAPPSSFFSVHDAHTLCHKHGGKMASIDQFDSKTLQSFLLSLNMAERLAGFWYSLSSGVNGCLFSRMLDTPSLFQEQLNLTVNTCSLTFGQPSHVICESETVAIQYGCQNYQFMCEDKTCLTPDLVCDGFHDCRGGEDELNCSLSMNYTCLNSREISIFKYCDFRSDCKDKTDEKRCISQSCRDSEWQCNNMECIPKERRCDHKPECADGSDEKQCDWGMECKTFRCKLVGCLPNTKVEDLHPDCPDATEADESYQLVKKMFPSFYRENGVYYKTDTFLNECPGYVDQQRCNIDHSRCYPRHRNCIFDQDVYGSLTNCRNGVHLRHCENFQCPGLFKCKQSYCIPVHKVCDGRNDCINGEDESFCEDLTCPYLLRCGKSSQCVAQENVCDGQIHCKSDNSDELFCDLTDWSCPEACSCFGYTMSCPALKLDTIPTVKFRFNLRILNFTLNHLSISNTTLLGFRSLAYFYLSWNAIKSLQPHTFIHSPNLLYLDLSDNHLETIAEGTFQGLGNLKTLILLRNPIHAIVDGSFWGLSRINSLNLSSMTINRLTTNVFDGLIKVEELDLSFNDIETIEPETFSSKKLTSLKTLLLVGNDLNYAGPEAFGSITVNRLETSSFRFCCFASQVPECEPEKDTYSSCSALLENNFLRAVVWLLGLLAMIANSSVIIWRIYDKISNVPSIFVLNLAISDLMMGMFLVSISLADVHYKGTYVLKDTEWRSSVFCNIIGVVATVSLEMSLFTLVVVAVDRTKRLAFPFSVGQISKKTAWIIEITGWIVCLALALIPLTMPSHFGMFYGRNSICVPFNFSDAKIMGWEYTTTIFVVVNSSALIIMVALYIVIYFSVKESGEAAGRTDRADLDLARNLSMIITSNMVCIIPIILANISSVAGYPVSREMASLLTAVLLPIKSVLNPCIFILSTVRSIRVAKQRASQSKNIHKSKNQTATATTRVTADKDNSRAPFTISKLTNLSSPT